MTRQWQQQAEGGGWLGLRLIVTIARVAGRRVTRLLLYPVTGYFYLRRPRERRAAHQFLTRIHGQPPTRRQVWTQMFRFAATLLDRVYLLARGTDGFAIDTEGVEELDTALDAGRGVLLMGAHMGSFDVLRAAAAAHPDVPLRIVLDTRQTPVMTSLFARLAPDMAAGIIDASGEPAATVLAVSEALAAGHMVGLLADRGRPSDSMRRMPFCGAPAPFPIGPWVLAARLQVPVVLCLGLYRGGNRYRLVFEQLATRVQLPRSERDAALDAVMRRYAERLEHHARAEPGNWFNFYDFWEDDAGAATVEAPASSAPTDGL